MTHVNANVVQQSFRARNDDGSETAATWIAAADGYIDLVGGGVFPTSNLTAPWVLDAYNEWKSLVSVWAPT